MTAENLPLVRLRLRAVPASMRPRPMTAENFRARLRIATKGTPLQ